MEELNHEPIVAPKVIMREGIPKRVELIGEDAELLAKTEHVRNRGECMYEFYARTGIDAHFLRHATEKEISDRVALVMNSDREEESVYVFEPTKIEMPQGGFLRRFIGKFKMFDQKDRPRRPIVVDTQL